MLPKSARRGPRRLAYHSDKIGKCARITGPYDVGAAAGDAPAAGASGKSAGDDVARPCCVALGPAGVAGATGRGAELPAIDIRLRLAGAAVTLPAALWHSRSALLGWRGRPAPRSRRHLSHVVRAAVRRLLLPGQQRRDAKQLRP